MPGLYLYHVWLEITLTVSTVRDAITEGIYSYEYYGLLLVTSMEENRQGTPTIFD